MLLFEAVGPRTPCKLELLKLLFVFNLCSTHSVINLLIKRGRVLWPSEWELAGTGIEVDVFGIWLSVSARLHLQWGNKQGHSTAHIE